MTGTRAPLLTRAKVLAMTPAERDALLDQVVADIKADAGLATYEELTKVAMRGPRTADIEITDVETGTVHRQTYVMTNGRWQFRRGRGTLVALCTFEAYLLSGTI